MTSRELVYQTLNKQGPNRIPRQLWPLPWAKNHYPQQYERIKQKYPDDIVGPDACYKKYPPVKGDMFKGTYVDEWGCVWENEQEGIVGQVKHPMIKSWDDLKKIRLPNELLDIDVDVVNAFCKKSDKFVLGGACPRPFERMQFLRGSENLLMDLALQENGLFELFDIVHKFNVKELQAWTKTDVDALWFMDDWGSQRSLLISPTAWRKFYKPIYKEYIDIAHNSGKKIFMHSDGYIIDILPDLIELGLDAINSQIFCMDIKKLSRRFKGKITFWGEIDRQQIIPYGSRQDVVNAVKMVKELLYDNGCVIAQCEFGAEANPDNVEAVFETWDSFTK
jgi:uroporphyrinogen-III decarboxylase